MKNKILDSLISIIRKNYNYNDTKLKEIRYGLESLYLSLFKIIVIIIISFFIHTTKTLFYFFITYGLLRLLAFGLHTKKSLHCWITSIITFALIPYIIKNTSINIYILITISLFSLILICIYAPADTEKRPLINKKKRIIYKIFSIIVSISYILLIIFINDFYVKRLLTFSLLLESLLINPFSYKLFGLKYNNYLKYKERRRL